MKVILLSELKGKGGEGDVVEVARGFANNYLLPQKIAIEATPGNLKQLEQRKKNIAKREETRIAEAEALRAKLEALTVKIDAQVGDEGQLFGSVTAPMVAAALLEQAEIEIDKRRIELGQLIKTAGAHTATIVIYRDIKASVNLLVGVDEPVAEAEEAVEEVVEEAAAEQVAEEAVEEAAADAE